MSAGKRIIVAVTLLLSIVTMAGCQAVGGVDVDKALLSTLDYDSYEGTYDFEWEFVQDPSQKPDEETSRMLSAFGKGKLSLADLKTENRSTASGEGTLTLPKGKIPFKLYMNGSRYIVDIEGAKKPFMLDPFTLIGAEDSLANAEEAGLLGVLADRQNETNRALTKAIVSFVLKITPNPKQISAVPVTEQINGKQTALTKVSLEVGAEEFAELAAKMLLNAAKDEKLLKEFIGSLYDALKPMLEQMNEEATGANPALSIVPENKEQAVDFIYELIKPMLQEMAAELEKPDSSAFAQISGFFSDDTKFQMDVLLNGVTPVGYNLNVVIAPSIEDNEGISAIRFSASSRQWNIGGSVKAEAYGGEVYEVKSELKPRKRLENLKKDSLLYEILKKDLKVTTHTFIMVTGENPRVTNGFSPYIKGAGTTMAPVRYVSEQLDTAVTWNGKTSTVTVRDETENITIVLKIGSKKALVNGKTVILPEAPERKFGTTFVPFAFIVKTLGGKAQWDPAGIVTITKEF